VDALSQGMQLLAGAKHGQHRQRLLERGELAVGQVIDQQPALDRQQSGIAADAFGQLAHLLRR